MIEEMINLRAATAALADQHQGSSGRGQGKQSIEEMCRERRFRTCQIQKALEGIEKTAENRDRETQAAKRVKERGMLTVLNCLG